MLRRTTARAATKAPQTPGPMMQSWGRSAQKRRLEYETVESKYGDRKFNKDWDVIGLEQRNTAHTAQRIYFNFPQRCVGYLYNYTSFYFIALLGGFIPFTVGYQAVLKLDRDTKRAAWW
uniref:Uncharacterized protein n=1 Tax=Neobodo designis TaxID=312471 RepID=A0A7S1MIL1_NEODS|eukprot:CAMPEP_0174849988 /NCGR_PEP_ID=MMETSP1114-20130205/18535_1 /TAXON_ID=312471 /ORGANISM="Neobodo designis, Strain CCAP 1951/1" /LENGTH=118 /DNA_ID=CAMNT_0016084409 /DNA_START=28 /DNA_END=384 /DNA_ORIENTATION=+